MFYLPPLIFRFVLTNGKLSAANAVFFMTETFHRYCYTHSVELKFDVRRHIVIEAHITRRTSYTNGKNLDFEVYDHS